MTFNNLLIIPDAIKQSYLQAKVQKLLADTRSENKNAMLAIQARMDVVFKGSW